MSISTIDRDLLDAQHRLTEAQEALTRAAEGRVCAIKAALEAGYSQTQVARTLGVTLASVNDTLRRRRVSR